MEAAAGASGLRSFVGTLYAAAPARPIAAPDVVRAAVLILALAAASLLRLRGAPALDTVWAEDGALFLQRAHELGLQRTLGLTYAGYLHVVPRLIAAVAAAAPVAQAAAVLAASAAVMSACCGAVVVAASGGLIRTPVVRYALGGLVVLAPIAAPETLNAVALTQWHLVVAAVWAARWRPRSTPAKAAAVTTLVAAALSAPLSLITAPLLFTRLFVVGDRGDRWLPAVGLGAQAVQLGALLTAPGQASGDPSALGATLGVYAQRVVTNGVLGTAIPDALWSALGPPLVVTVVAVTLALLVAGVLRGGVSTAVAIAVLGGLSLVAFVGSVSLRGVVPAMAWTSDVAVGSGSRYAYVPALLLLGAVGAAVDALLRAGSRVVPGLALAVVLGTVLLDLPAQTVRSRGPRWSDAVADAAEACRAPDAPRAVRIPHPPQQRGQDWGTVLPCATVLDGA